MTPTVKAWNAICLSGLGAVMAASRGAAQGWLATIAYLMVKRARPPRKIGISPRRRLLVIQRISIATVACVAVCTQTVPAGAAVTVPSVPNPIAAVKMACADGGIDLNKASIAQLTVLPDISEPVAKRIVAQRPYLRIDPDLLRVAGIGQGKLAAIVADGRACATPTSKPPPYFDVCKAGDGRIDANRPQSESALASLFGTPTAQRIVRAIPYWNLNHVRSEGEAGAGYGKMAKLMGRLCLTPPTIVYDGVRYGWIDPDRGGYVDWPATDGGGVVSPDRPGRRRDRRARSVGVRVASTDADRPPSRCAHRRFPHPRRVVRDRLCGRAA